MMSSTVSRALFTVCDELTALIRAWSAFSRAFRQKVTITWLAEYHKKSYRINSLEVSFILHQNIPKDMAYSVRDIPVCIDRSLAIALKFTNWKAFIFEFFV